MPRYDPQIEVVCDKCEHSEIWEPIYVYNDWSGNSGQYETDDSAFEKWATREGWTVEGEETFCEDCSEGRA